MRKNKGKKKAQARAAKRKKDLWFTKQVPALSGTTQATEETQPYTAQSKTVRDI